MKKSLSILAAGLVMSSTIATAQTSTANYPAPTLDEMQMAISAVTKIMVVEKCGHTRRDLPVYKRIEHFVATHHDPMSSTGVKNRIAQGAFMSLIGKNKAVNEACQKINASSESQFRSEMDNIDAQLIAAHQRAGHAH